MSASPLAPLLRIVVVFSPEPGQLDVSHLQLPEGTTLAQAVAASGIVLRHPTADGLPAGIWGKKHAGDALLRDADRVEIYRPLRCDPKEARRLRYRQRTQARKPGAGAVDAGELKPST